MHKAEKSKLSPFCFDIVGSAQRCAYKLRNKKSFRKKRRYFKAPFPAFEMTIIINYKSFYLFSMVMHFELHTSAHTAKSGQPVHFS